MTADSTRQIRNLLTKYENVEKNRAFGGRWALAGFEYQFLVYLERLVDLLICRDTESIVPEAMPLPEAFSDMFTLVDGVLEFVQVKRTLESGNWRDAAKEALIIVRFLEAEAPEFLPDKVRFVIATSSDYWPARKTIESVVAELAEELGVAKEAADITLAALKRSEGIRAPHDRMALYGKLWKTNILHRGEFIDHSMGLLLKACARVERDHDRMEVVAEITSLFDRSKGKAVTLPGEVWTYADFKSRPSAGGWKPLFDNRPKPRHLAEGRVMPRPAVEDRLWRDFKAWRSTEGDPDDGISTFWISGRPGDGKSVLLLQLIERFLASREGSAVYNIRPPELIQFLESLQAVREQTGPLLLVIDDLHDGLADDPSLRREVSDAAASLQHDLRIVTCGPKRQRQAFTKSFGRAFKIEPFEIPKPSTDDGTALAKWLSHQLSDGSLIEGVAVENKLFVELAVELRFGKTPKEFADRLHAAYSKSIHFHAVVSALALSALDLLTPASLFGIEVWQEQRDLKIDDFVREDTARVGQLEVRGLRFFWHPAFATHIFTAWLVRLGEAGLASKSVVGSALGRAACLWEADGEAGYAVRCLSTLRDASILEPLVGDEPHAWTMTSAYESFMEQGGNPSTSMVLGSWLRCKLTKENLKLIPDPIDIAVSSITVESASQLGNSNSLSALLELARDDRFKERLGRFVPRMVDIGLSDAFAPQMTSFVARLATTWSTLSSDLAVGEWLKRHADSEESGPVLEAALSRSGSFPELTSIALNWVGHAPNRPRAGNVIESLVANGLDREGVLATAIDWVSDRDNRHRAGNVINALVANGLDKEGVLKTALDWVSERDNSQRAGGVIEVLVANGLDKEGVLKTALDWVSERDNSQRAGIVIVALVANGLDKEGVLKTAIDWVSDRDNRHRAGNVINALVANGLDKEGVLKTALDWVSERDNSQRAGIVIVALVANGLDKEGVLKTALDWVSERDNTDRAAEVLRALVSAAGEDSNIVEMVWAWASDSRNRKWLPDILLAAMRWSVSSPNILRQADLWYESNPSHPQAVKIVRLGLIYAPNKAKWIERAEDLVMRKDKERGNVLVPLAIGREWPATSIPEIRRVMGEMTSNDRGFVLASLAQTLLSRPEQAVLVLEKLRESEFEGWKAHFVWVVDSIVGCALRKPEFEDGWEKVCEAILGAESTDLRDLAITRFTDRLESRPGSVRSICYEVLARHPEATLGFLRRRGSSEKTERIANDVGEALTHDAENAARFFNLALGNAWLPLFLIPTLQSPVDVTGLAPISAAWIARHPRDPRRNRVLKALATHPEREAVVRRLIENA